MFGRGFKIFSLFGIPVYLDWTFFLVVPLFAWLISSNFLTYATLVGLEQEAAELAGVAQEQRELPDGRVVEVPTVARPGVAFGFGVFVTIGLYLSVLIHEFGHALTARMYGVKTERVTLWLLGGVASFERMPRQPGAEAIVAIAGPLTSFAVAAVLWLLAIVTPGDATLWQVTVKSLAVINVILAVFNLLPALPLDGGRVLRSLLALKLPYMRATQISAVVSKILAALLVIYALLPPGIEPMLILVAIFIWMAVSAETRQSAVESVLKGIHVGDLMTREVHTVPPDMTAGELVGEMHRTGHLGFPVIDADAMVLGMVSLRDLQADFDPAVRVGEIMRPGCLRSDVRQPVQEVFQEMGRHGFERCAVTDDQGRLVGLVTKGDLIRFLQLNSMRQQAASMNPAAWRAAGESPSATGR